MCHISEPDNPDNLVVSFRLANGIGRHFHAQPQNRFFTYLVPRLGVRKFCFGPADSACHPSTSDVLLIVHSVIEKLSGPS